MTERPNASSLTLSDAALAAHTAWLDRGRTGEGQLRLRGRTFEGDLSERDLRYMDFEDCDFRRTKLSETRLDGARFRGCSFEEADLRRASAIDGRFERCDLRRAAIADFRIGPTGFLRCHLGDYAAQPVGRPDVRGPYAVVSPDLSNRADGSRIGTAAEIDLRWFTPPKDGIERRFEERERGRTVSIRVLHMHLAWVLEAGPRSERKAAEQTFRQFLLGGPPIEFEGAISEAVLEKVRSSVQALSASWTAPDPLP